MVFTDVDPEAFTEVKSTDYKGRSAWTRRGFDYADNRYMLSPRGKARAGSKSDLDLDHWAVAAGVHAIRLRLMQLSLIDAPDAKFVGNFGTEMQDAVKAFQSETKDVETGRPLVVDGIVGRTDAKALWTPLIDQIEGQNDIPDHLVRGMLMNESGLDPGAVGYFCWYANSDGSMRWGGVDRGLHQSNSKARANVSWVQAYDPIWAIETTGDELRQRFDALLAKYPGKDYSVYWDAAVCSHNSPAYGESWAKSGGPPNLTAATYVNHVKASVY